MNQHRQCLAAVLVTGGLLFSTAGCEQAPAGAGAKSHGDPAAQWYHAYVAAKEGDKIPFFLLLPDDCERETVTIVNGEERIRAACQNRVWGVVIDFPVYGTQIEAWFGPDGVLKGYWTRELPNERQRMLPFEARPVSNPDPRARFSVESTEAKPDPPRIDLSGTWRMEFDLHEVARGVFVQTEAGVVRGTVEVPSQYGDLRFLSGNVHGEKVLLSTFDGQHALLLKGHARTDGSFEGELVLGNNFRDPFVAVRGDLQVPDPLERVQWTSSDTRTRFDLAPLRSPRFAGKAVIVEIFGTWCPNGNDVTPVLAELYAKHHAEGLEVLGLAFEFSDDSEYNARRVREFKEKHGVGWEVVIAETSFEDLAYEGLAGLSPIEGVPVTVFVNRDGTVHEVYTGFSGPATGEAYVKAKADFEKLTGEILHGM